MLVTIYKTKDGEMDHLRTYCVQVKTMLANQKNGVLL